MNKSVFLPVIAIAVAALVLLGASLGLNRIAMANAQAEHLRMMQTILPGSTAFTAEPYAGDDASIRSVHKGETGFVVETVTAGYAGDITMLIGVSKEGSVTGLVVRDMNETFTLGANALRDHEFLALFLNSKGGIDDVDAISGATVTSRAIVRCVNSAVGYVTGADAQSAATSWGG